MLKGKKDKVVLDKSMALKDRKFKSFIRVTLLVFLFFILLFGTVALAQSIEFKPNVPIPGADNVNTLPEYIAALYKFLVGIAGILAVVMITFGGLLWLFSGGSPDKISKAKEIIFGAVIGLIIALSSYLILNTINPDLVKFKFTVPSINKLILSRTWCKDVELSDELRNSYWKSKGGASFDADQTHTECGQIYEIPGTNGKQTCYGAYGCGANEACGFSLSERNQPPTCLDPKRQCEAIFDDTTGYFNLAKNQSACDWVTQTMASNPNLKSCKWYDRSGFIEAVGGIAITPFSILFGGQTFNRLNNDDGCYYTNIIPRNFTNEWTYDPGIQDQIGDISEQLGDLLTCLRYQLNVLQPEANKPLGRISSISDSNYIGNLAACANPASCPIAPVACKHSCKPTTSCHYGNPEDNPRKSYAVDIGDEENGAYIESAMIDCHSLIGFHVREVDHYHISTPACPRN